MTTPASLEQLQTGQCRPLGVRDAVSTEAIAAQLSVLPDWRYTDGAIEARFRFDGWWQTIGFVNALAWMADGQDHSPDLAVSYDRCTVIWRTHSAGGVTLNDFICAARTDALYHERAQR